MRKFVSFIFVAGLLTLLGAALWHGWASRSPGDKRVKEEEAAAEKAEDYTVNLEKEKAEALGLEKNLPEAAEQHAQRMAFGRVLDPTPLVMLEGDLSAAEAVLEASRAENERSRRLLAAGESTSRKLAEAAEAQFRADESKWRGLQRRATMEWGETFGALPREQRRALADSLAEGSVSLARVDILPGNALPENPASARLLVLGREQQPITATAITPASDVDPKAQAQGYLLRIDNPPFTLRPGMALTVWLGLAEPARTGFALPRSAILRHDGRTWVYVQTEAEKFVRKPVHLDSPLEGEKGWFVETKAGGLAADDLLVVTGAESLLSEELKSAGGGEPD